MNGYIGCLLDCVAIFTLTFISVWMLLAQLLKALQKAGVFDNMSLDDRELQDMEKGVLGFGKGCQFRG